jgi:hypothetical protein
MSRFAVLPSSLVALCLIAGAQPALAQRWSPDGAWVAYRQIESEPAQTEREILSWLIDSKHAPRTPEGTPRTPREASKPPPSRIWATRVADRESVLVTQTQGDLTEPCWTRQSSGLFFARLLAESGQPARLELVLREALDRERVVASRNVTSTSFSETEVSDALWSPDGAHLVAPLVDPPGLWIVRLADGKTLHEIPGASHASWSPEGHRLAFFEQGALKRLCTLDLRTDEIRRLAEYPDAHLMPHPLWSRDGQILQYVIASGTRGRGRNQTEGALRLARLRLEPLDQQRFLELNEGPDRPENPLRGCAFALDADENNLFSTADYDHQPSLINWIRTANGEVHKRLNPFHETVPIRALQACPLPGKHLLALRIGEAGRPGLPALCDAEPAIETFVPLVPDDSARSDWLRIIYAAMADVLAKLDERSEVEDWDAAHPTRLPFPGELGEGSRGRRRLLRLAAIGRSVVEAVSGTSGDTPDPGGARLVFDYILGDYNVVLGGIDQLEQAALDPETRLRLLGFRAQTLLGQGRHAQAGAIVDYLRAQPAQPVELIEELPGTGRWRIEPEPVSSQFSWIEPLARHVDALSRPGRSPNPSEPEQEPGFGDESALPEPELQDAPRMPPPPPAPMVIAPEGESGRASRRPPGPG